MQSSLLAAMEERVLVYDGAMGTQLQATQLSQGDFTLRDDPLWPKAAREAHQRLGNRYLEGCNELLNLTRPDAVEQVHLNYLAAGSDLIETNTFGCSSIVLGEYEIADLVYDLTFSAAQIARKAADKMSTTDRPRFVVGAVGPGTKLVTLGQTSWMELEDTYREACRGLLEGGADGLLMETLQDLLMVKASIVAANKAMADTGKTVPLFVQVTMEQTGTMLLGSELAAALNMIECFPSVKAFGMNCATGPVEMVPHIQFLARNSTRPIAIQPNAGLPVMEKGHAHYRLTPEELAHHHHRFTTEFGVAMAGGCCGTTPDHIRAVAETVGGQPHRSSAHWMQVRSLFPGFDFELRTTAQEEAIALKGCSSLYQFQPYEQDLSYLIVGEKTNANGSKAFRDLLAAENWEALTELARELEAEGSHVLDVCTAYVGRDEARDMSILLAAYNRHITAPIMIDSTESPVIERALQCLAGKPIVNSINFEDGGARTEKVLQLCRTYGAGVVALTIDEEGMAKTAARKVRVAERLLERCHAHGVAEHDVFIDCLTFTLGSGDEEFRQAGMETIEAIRLLREKHPRVNTILGVSNISFGLKPAARVVLNSAFLHYCREAGLNSAIVHFSKILPDNRIDPEVWKIASDLVYDRRTFASA